MRITSETDKGVYCYISFNLTSCKISLDLRPRQGKGIDSLITFLNKELYPNKNNGPKGRTDPKGHHGSKSKMCFRFLSGHLKDASFDF